MPEKVLTQHYSLGQAYAIMIMEAEEFRGFLKAVHHIFIPSVAASGLLGVFRAGIAGSSYEGGS
jgi:hypothetical protein